MTAWSNPLRRIVATAALVGLVTVGALGDGSRIVGAQAPGGPALDEGSGAGGDPGAPTGPAGPATLDLLGQDRWIGPRGTFRLSVKVVTPGEGYAVEAVLFRQVSGAEEILEADDAAPTRTVGRIGSRRPVPAGTTTEIVEIVVVPDEDGTAGYPFVLDPGVYPVEVRLLAPSGERAATVVTHLVHLSEELEAEPLDIGLLADVRLAPARTPDGRARLDTAAVDRLRRQLDALAAFGTVPMTVRIDPETVAALAETRAGVGGPALTSLTRLAGRMSAGSADVLASTYVGFDEAAWIADGADDVLDAELDRGAATLEAAGLRYLPTTVALRGALDLRLADRLIRRGVDRIVAPGVAMVTDRTGSTERGGAPVVATIGPAPATTTDRAGLLVLPSPTDAVRDVGPSLGMGVLEAHRLLAALLVEAVDGARGGRHVRLDLSAVTDDVFLSTFLTSFTGDGPLRPLTLDRQFTATPSHGEAVPFGPPAAGGSTVPRSSRVAATADRVDGVRALLDDDALADVLEGRVLLAPADDLDDLSATALIDGVEAEVRAVTDTVVIPGAQAFTTTSHQTSIPLVLRNASDGDVHVALTLQSNEIEFTGPNPQTVVLRPGPNDLEIPIRMRRSGEFRFRVAVHSPDDSIVLGDVDVRVQSRAISGVGLFLSVGALVFLLVWWIRNARRRRRLRRSLDPAAGPGPERRRPPAATVPPREVTVREEPSRTTDLAEDRRASEVSPGAPAGDSHGS